MTKSQSTRRLRLPVKFIDGRWESAFGGEVPVEEGATAQIVIERGLIKDRQFLATMEKRGRIKILEEETPLLVMLDVKPNAEPHDQRMKSLLIRFAEIREQVATEFLDSFNPGTLCFVKVRLAGPNDKQARLFNSSDGGLWLTTQGIEATELASTTILLPEEITKDCVTSLNHALTKLSEVFETWRISHTGNIYTRVLYQEQNGRWYPLDILRDKTLVNQEQAIASALWRTFMSKMNFSI